jgi:hypothetical protein
MAAGAVASGNLAGHAKIVGAVDHAHDHRGAIGPNPIPPAALVPPVTPCSGSADGRAG